MADDDGGDMYLKILHSHSPDSCIVFKFDLLFIIFFWRQKGVKDLGSKITEMIENKKRR